MAPKCDSLDDGCMASRDTRVSIQDSAWTITPPLGWAYAHERDGVVARSDNAIVAVTLHDTGDRKSEVANRAAAFELVAQKMGLTPNKKFTFPATPDKTVRVSTWKIDFYQFDNASRDGQPGALLVFSSRLPEGQSILGAGFVLESDTSNADEAILACSQSLEQQTRTDATTPNAARGP